MQAVGFLPLFETNNLYKKKFLGRPLFCWVLAEAIFSDLNQIYVATNNESIKNFISRNYSWTNKIAVDSLDNQTDAEQIFQNFRATQGANNDIFCLLNPFSPFTTSQIINKAISKIAHNSFDVVSSVVEVPNRIWNPDLSQTKKQALLLENQALWCASRNTSEVKKGNVEMPLESLFLVSEKNWEIVEKSMAEILISEKETKAIKFLVLDVDGVFTDGGVYYDAQGELTKRFDIRDGMGLEILREHNVEVVIMTSEDSALVKKRMEKLKIKHVFLFAKDKHSLLENFIRTQNISRAEIAYIGDDVNDLANLCSVGWSFCPLNATNNVKPFVDTILSKNAGNGAIREATERILLYNKRF